MGHLSLFTLSAVRSLNYYCLLKKNYYPDFDCCSDCFDYSDCYSDSD